MTNRFLRFLLYLLLFILPLQTRYFAVIRTINNQWWEYGSFTVYASECLLWVIVLTYLSRLLYARVGKYAGLFTVNQFRRLVRSAKNNPAFFFAGIFILYALASTIWSYDRASSLIYSLRLIEVVLLVAILALNSRHIRVFAVAFVVGVAVHALLGIGEFYAQTVWGSAFLGIAPQNSIDLGVAVVETNFRRYIRAYGGFPHPNIFGGWLVAALVLVIFVYPHGILRTSREFIWRIGALCLYSALFAALVVSFSRSAWVGFTVGLASFCALVFFRRLRDFFGKNLEHHLKAWFEPAALVKFLFINGIIAVFLGVLLFEPLVERGSGAVFATSAHRLEQKSVIEREIGVYEGMRVFQQFPFFGAGIGAYTSVLHNLYPERAVWEIQPAHSVLLMILAELGAMGAILAVAAFFFFLRYLYCARNAIGLILVGAFIPLMLFDHYLWTLYSGIMLAGAVCGLAIAAGKQKNSYKGMFKVATLQKQ